MDEQNLGFAVQKPIEKKSSTPPRHGRSLAQKLPDRTAACGRPMA
jgi:hypothetical protein